MSILIILLGCHISRILMDRVNTASNFAEYYNLKLKYYNIDDYKINWFLTGGVKHRDTPSYVLTEAEKMENLLITQNNNQYNWNYIIDTVSTNTAENFIMANQLNDKYTFEDIYVVTSEFHYERANKIASLINNKINYKWILSSVEESDSRYWERIHMKNIENDVISAKRNLLVR